MRFIFQFIFLYLQTVAAQAFTDSTTVSGSSDGISCKAYLHIPEGQLTPRPLVLVAGGSGLYSLSQISETPSAVEYVFLQNKAVVRTFEKPGIRPNPIDQDKPAVEDLVYNRHTQKDLIECAKNALIWALGRRDTVKNEIYFFGHSEGSMVLTRLYAEILSSSNVVASNVQALLLSGTPMQSWHDIINSQLLNFEDRQKFWAAFANKSDEELRKFGELPFAYWDDILKTEPLSKTYQELVEKNPAASLNFFHGLQDKNTSVTQVLELESWN